MSSGEPPSTGPRTAFLVGRNSRGNWVVQDPSGLRGGLFVDRVQALKYAMSENGHSLGTVVMVPHVLELDLSTRPGLSDRPSDDPQRKQVA
jgi:hypothetical protein